MTQEYIISIMKQIIAHNGACYNIPELKAKPCKACPMYTMLGAICTEASVVDLAEEYMLHYKIKGFLEEENNK
jgi:hypothetical protein